MTSTPIVVGDAIYGLNSYGKLRGVDATTGERLWSSDRLVPEDRWASSHRVQHQDRSFVVPGPLDARRRSNFGLSAGSP